MKGYSEGKKSNWIFSFKGANLIIPFLFISGIMYFASCTKGSEFTIGENFVESQTRLTVIDTYKVDLSTMLLDSMVTSTNKIGLVGSYKDDIFGSVKSETFFDLNFEAFADLDDHSVFDSAAIELKYSGYSYGDTLAPMTINLHRLTERIATYDNGYLYNTSSFKYDPVPLASVVINPEPKTDSLLRIHIDALGEELYTLIKEKDQRIKTEEWFMDYIKGFVVTPGNADDKVVLGFKTDVDKLYMKIYYHIDGIEPVKKTISISMGLISHQFNKITFDLSGTPLSSIVADGNVIPSSQTDNKAYMQGLIGLMPKIQFPSLKDVLLDERHKILRAELVVTPVKNSFSLFSLPKKLYLYNTYKSNQLSSTLKNSDGNALIADFQLDERYNDDTKYTYDITNFINGELSDYMVDYNHGVVIGLLDSEFRSSLDRLIVEGKKPAVKLRLYYLTY